MMVNPIDKVAVARSFGRAAQKYDSAAHFQRWVADRLLKGLPDHAMTRDALTLDLGCGTGYCIERLSSAIEVVGLDLSEGMLRVAREKVGGEHHWAAGDAERLPFKSRAFDLIISSLSIQWCENTDLLFHEIARVLKPGGMFCFSTLVDGTLQELKTSWAAADRAQHVNDFETESHYRAVVARAGFATVDLINVRHVLEYGSVRDLLGELKAIGAHNMTPERSRTVTPKSTYRQFEAAYEEFRMQDGKLPATYEVLFGYLTR